MINRDKYAVITEWGLKIFLIFFFSSFFFQSFIRESLGTVEGMKIGFFVKIIIISAFGIFITIIERNIFKLVAFAFIILGSFFKVFMVISQKGFNVSQIFEIADYALLISISIYYLYRHFPIKKDKSKIKRSKSARNHHQGELSIKPKN